jgi:hypothetical protein
MELDKKNGAAPHPAPRRSRSSMEQAGLSALLSENVLA